MKQLANMLLSMKNKPGTFATDGVLHNSPFPGLIVEGVGQIPLPLSSQNAQQIISVAQQAPFGLGEKTIVDEKVRLVFFVETLLKFSISGIEDKRKRLGKGKSAFMTLLF